MKNRLFAIDAVRGWVMIFMALDHALYFCYEHIVAEGFQGVRPESMPGTAHYLTRFITHYCAPTFIFLAGFSVALYTFSRRSRHFSETQITSNLLIRGFLLITLQMTVVNLTWGFYSLPDSGILYFGVLSCIGSGLIVLAFARRLPMSLLVSSSILLLLLVPFLLKTFTLESGTDHLFLEIALQPNTEGWLNVLYPILPWLGVMGLGCACGLWIGNKPEKITRVFLSLGALMLVFWFLLRLGGGYGNLTPYQGGNWRDFMLMSKYPPSLVFLLWNLGGMAIALGVHAFLKSRLPFKRFWSIVVLFGQTPLFFYVVHLYLYKTLSFIPWGNTLSGGYVAWLIGLAIMIPLCTGYRSLKRKHPSSVLRYV